MKNLLVMCIFFLIVSCAGVNQSSSLDKIYVVERERESLAVIERNESVRGIKGLGNLNHATLKFKNGHAFILARDGYISKVDTASDLLIKKVKIGKSGIGITFTDSQIVVVNYEPNSVVVLDFDLNILKVIETNSRNVGVKYWNHLLVFSLMDKNQIWILDTREDFKVIKKIEDAGSLPFDALIKDHLYVVGFFKESSIGVLDLKSLEYKKLILGNSAGDLTYKVPHFGYWGVVNDIALIPMVSSDKLLVLDLKTIKPIKEIDLIGRPVFATVSPDKKTVVVSYSGNQEDFISIIDTDKLARLIDIKAGQRIMHFRFSLDGNYFYTSSYFENKINIFDTIKWEKIGSVAVATPSGIFIKEQE